MFVQVVQGSAQCLINVFTVEVVRGTCNTSKNKVTKLQIKLGEKVDEDGAKDHVAFQTQLVLGSTVTDKYL